MKIALSTEPEAMFPLLKRSLQLYRASFSHVFLLAFLLAVITFTPTFVTILMNQDAFINLSQFNFNRLWLITFNLAGLLFFPEFIR